MRREKLCLLLRQKQIKDDLIRKVIAKQKELKELKAFSTSFLRCPIISYFV